MTRATYFNAGDLRIRILESSGTGPVVFFLHANSGSSDPLASLFESPLASKYRFLAVDFPGHGASPPSAHPARDYSVLGLSSLLTTLANDFVSGPYVVVGHSLGGHVASTALPELRRAVGLMLISAPPINQTAMAEAFLPDPSDGAMFAGELSPPLVDKFAQAQLGLAGLAPALLDSVKAAIRKTDAAFRPALLASIQSGRFADERANVESSPVPTCFLYGTRDPFLRTDYFRKISLRAPYRGGVHAFEQSGHSPHLDSPEAFSTFLAHFLDEGANW